MVWGIKVKIDNRKLVSLGLAGILWAWMPGAWAASESPACEAESCPERQGLLVRVISEGEERPRKDGNNPENFSNERRVDITAEGQVRKNTPMSEEQGLARIGGEYTVYLPTGGVMWATEDPAVTEPRLSITGQQRVKLREGNIIEPLAFHYYTNYGAYIERLELSVYRQSDIDLVEPVVQITTDQIANVGKLEWSGVVAADYKLRAGDNLVYVLRAFDHENRMDETSGQTLQLLTPEEYAAAGSAILGTRGVNQSPDLSRSADIEAASIDAGPEIEFLSRILGQNRLRRQTIPIYGSRVRIYGQDLPAGYQLTINDQKYPVDLERKFAAEFLLPAGHHQFDIKLRQDDKQIERRLAVDVTGKYVFMVALADITASENRTTGSVEPLAADDRYQEDFLIEGRLAFYLKGKVKGKYLVTAQADTRERELQDMFDGFLDKDPEDVFRRLDPDRYYPVYGDDSTTYRDVDTQGRLYVRIDWDKSQALWGNFNTGVTGTEFAQYNRSLYGAALNWRSIETTSLGESATQALGFVSEAQTALGHTEFLGTGGSLYYLKHTDILPGSDKLAIEIRDRDSGRVVERIELVRGADYEVDEIQGRIILARPLRQFSRENLPSIIRDEPLDGNDHILLADYEYLPEGFDADHLTAGGRVKHWLGEHLAVGATYVEENRAGDDYQLAGADVTLQAGRGTYLKVEAAHSESRQASVFFSDNGGLSFVELNAGTSGALEGDAKGVEARANFRELGWTDNELTAGAWWKETDAGYSVARRETGVDTLETGAEVSSRVTDDLSMAARASTFERQDERKLEQANLLGEYRFNDDITLSGELRQVRESRGEVSGEGTLAAVQYRQRLNRLWEIYTTGQVTLKGDDDYSNNDLLTLGAKYLFADRSSLGAEYSTGHRGNAGSILLDWQVNNDHTVYSRYTASTDRTESIFGNRLEDGLVLGHRSRVSSQVTLYNESQLLDNKTGSGLVHAFGLDFAPAQGWLVGFSLQHGDLEATSGDVQRDAATISAGYRSPETQWQSKLEYREDEGAEQRTQWLTTNRLTHRINAAWRLAAKFNHSDTEDGVNPDADARFTEGSIGFAYRPVSHDRWNLLGKYTYLYDLRSLEQIESGSDQRSDIFSLEGIYEIHPQWEMAAKLARRTGEVRAGRGSGPWFESTANFAAVQGRYHLIHQWDGLLEYRMLEVEEDNSLRKGWLMGLDRHVGAHMKLGIGYNFTDFSDDLSELDYEFEGWFINLVGKY